MTLKEELEHYKKDVVELMNERADLREENEWIKCKNSNLLMGIMELESERNRLGEYNHDLEKEKEQIFIKLSKRIRSLEAENRDLESKGIKLQQIYNEKLRECYKKYMDEIAKARDISKCRETLECLNRNNGNKARTAKELGISRQALYKRIKKIGVNNRLT
ncbi:helix-turn-helix domain-containing protein [Clostridium sp. WILCCON 0269]|uniref:Helix-turn-helix domain-containing protein n=1 Tax=Candidatus Clostridium eludens TaxID=3381663 RepID=A0ABW8SEF1_9CLOT